MQEDFLVLQIFRKDIYSKYTILFFLVSPAPPKERSWG
jgi:hypothetical protein